MTGFAPEVREIITRRASDRYGVRYCERCGLSASDMQYHHRRPRGMGSTRRLDSNTASACLLLCGMCHLHIESYRTEALDKGWLVRQTQTPLSVPVLYRGRWVLLDDDGYTYRIPAPVKGEAS